MTALELKQKVLKPQWANKFWVKIHISGISNDWYHCPDDEEVGEGCMISLVTRSKLIIKTK